MDAATSRHIAADLHHEIEKLEIRMSTKADQIAKLTSHQNKVKYQSMALCAHSPVISSVCAQSSQQLCVRTVM